MLIRFNDVDGLVLGLIRNDVDVDVVAVELELEVGRCFLNQDKSIWVELDDVEDVFDRI